MRKLLVSLCILPVLCFAAPKKPLPRIEVPTVQVEPEITQEDLFKTVQHIQELAKEQQKELDAAKTENEKIKNELGLASIAHSQAKKEADELQVKVNKVTDDRNEQARQKDAALDKIDVLKKEIDKLIAHIHKLKWAICSTAAGALFLALMWLGAPRWFPPYSIGLTILMPVLGFGILWLLI